MNSNNTCVSLCADPQIGYQGACTNCGSTCYRCIDNPYNCISCTGQFKLYENTCITDCPIGYFVSTMNSSSICTVCPVECTVCSSSTNCSQCAPNFVFYLNFCYSNCPVSMYINNVSLSNSSTIIR